MKHLMLNRTLPTDASGRFKMPEDGWYQIAPKGDFAHAEAGVTQVIDDPAVAAMINSFTAAAAQPNFPGVLVDFDHFSLDHDKASAAAGWIVELQNRADGLWAKIRWSDAGAEAVAGGRYRFISPVWKRSDCEELGQDRVRPLKLLNAALTNDPNLKTITPLTNRKPVTVDSATASRSTNARPRIARLSRINNRDPETLSVLANWGSGLWIKGPRGFFAGSRPYAKKAAPAAGQSMSGTAQDDDGLSPGLSHYGSPDAAPEFIREIARRLTSVPRAKLARLLASPLGREITEKARTADEWKTIFDEDYDESSVEEALLMSEGSEDEAIIEEILLQAESGGDAQEDIYAEGKQDENLPSGGDAQEDIYDDQSAILDEAVLDAFAKSNGRDAKNLKEARDWAMSEFERRSGVTEESKRAWDRDQADEAAVLDAFAKANGRDAKNLKEARDWAMSEFERRSGITEESKRAWEKQERARNETDYEREDTWGAKRAFEEKHGRPPATMSESSEAVRLYEAKHDMPTKWAGRAMEYFREQYGRDPVTDGEIAAAEDGVNMPAEYRLDPGKDDTGTGREISAAELEEDERRALRGEFAPQEARLEQIKEQIRAEFHSRGVNVNTGSSKELVDRLAEARLRRELGNRKIRNAVPMSPAFTLRMPSGEFSGSLPRGGQKTTAGARWVDRFGNPVEYKPTGPNIRMSDMLAAHKKAQLAKLARVPRKWGEKRPGEVYTPVEGPGNPDWEARNPDQKQTPRMPRVGQPLPRGSAWDTYEKLKSVGMDLSTMPEGNARARLWAMGPAATDKYVRRIRQIKAAQAGATIAEQKRIR